MQPLLLSERVGSRPAEHAVAMYNVTDRKGLKTPGVIDLNNLWRTEDPVHRLPAKDLNLTAVSDS